MTSNKDTHYLVFDISNLLYRTFFNSKNEDDSTIAGLATHSALITLNKYYKMFKPKKVVMAFDRTSWRKAYTASSQCISQRPYKGNRRQDMTPAQQAKFERFIGHLRELEGLIINYSTIIPLVGEHLEADDLIAAFVQTVDQPTTIISTDSDLAQLLKHKHVSLISPATDKPHSLEKFNDDAKYYLFQKCIRGDSTDNIQSAFPNVRSTRIMKAYTDPFEYTQLMNETWTNQNGKQFVVEQLFKENQMLIDLEKQPDMIRELLSYAIEDALNTKKTFSLFHFMKYLGKFKLDKISASFNQYLPLLASK